MESSPKRRKLDHAGNGFASSFVLQTEELLQETKLDYGETFDGMDSQVHKIREAIDSIEPHDPIPIAEATRNFVKTHQIAIPYPSPAPADDSHYKLSYAKPSQYNVVGSYVSGTMVKSQSRFGVDMVVEMPGTLFQEKDYQDMRYFYRRAYFLANIASGVRKELGHLFNLEFECLNENPLLPVLVLQPKSSSAELRKSKKDSSKNSNEGKLQRKGDQVVRIIPCAPDGLFPTAKLSARACCNRPRKAENGKDSTSTPFYNSTLKAEMTFIAYLRILARAKKECQAFPDACVLGRLWLQQRGLGSSISRGGFGHFEWSLMLALLMQMGGGKKGQVLLSSSLRSSELFKAAMQFLATTVFLKKPFSFPSPQGGAKSDTISAKEGGLGMIDPVRDLNILFKMSPWSASLLQQHAKQTLELLDDGASDQFGPTFIAKANQPLLMFDLIFEVRSSDSDAVSTSDTTDGRGPVWNFSLETYGVLKNGLGDRAQLLHIQQQEQAPWDIKSQHRLDNSSNILVGIAFDPANMARIMEYGPPAEERNEATKFREFWGDRAELRRFKDGRILECVEWTKRSAFEICEEICHYVLEKHLRLGPKNVRVYDGGLFSVLPISPLDRDAFDATRKAFQILESDIRNLSDTPLQVRQLVPIAPEQRYSSLEAPMLGFHGDSLRPMDVNLYFEASSRWPENLVAIQEAKIEFLLDIDRRLTATNEAVTTYLGREDVGLGIQNLAYLDVVYENGATFRFRVHCDTEETLLDRQVKNKTLDQHIRAEAEEALFDFRSLFTHLPLHTQTISTFCTRLPALSPTIRLAKHWFNCHKLSGHVSEEFIELLVLSVFLNPHPWRAPSSVATGFLRTMLFLSKWDWRDEPLIVDFDDSISAPARSSMQKELAEWRGRDPNMNRMVLFVATSHDRSGLAYTRRSPSKVAATRMTVLAKAACRLVREQGIELDAKQLFRTSLHDYDVLIHLSSKVVKKIVRESSSGVGVKHSQFKNLDERTGKMPLPLARHPVAVLLDTLAVTFEDTLIFFHGSPEDSVIGAIWHPKLRRENFRSGLLYNFRSVVGNKDGDLVETNRIAVLLEIARISGDMIKRIEEAQDRS